jgi:hypothetical protein
MRTIIAMMLWRPRIPKKNKGNIPRDFDAEPATSILLGASREAWKNEGISNQLA